MKPKLLVLLSCALALFGAASRVEAGLGDVVAEPVFTELENPVWVTHDSTGTLIVTLLPGLVLRQVGGGISATAVLDIQARVRGGGGLHSVAFHPSEPWLFAHYSEPPARTGPPQPQAAGRFRLHRPLGKEIAAAGVENTSAGAQRHGGNTRD